MPDPGKLQALQKWELPQTVSHLRSFLGVCTYYSTYVHHFAGIVAPLTDLLRVSKEEGKKRSRKPLSWTAVAVEAFHSIKKALAERLELFQVQPDQSFVLRIFCPQVILVNRLLYPHNCIVELFLIKTIFLSSLNFNHQTFQCLENCFVAGRHHSGSKAF